MKAGYSEDCKVDECDNSWLWREIKFCLRFKSEELSCIWQVASWVR